MSPSGARWLSMPDGVRLRAYLGWSLVLNVLFVTVYGGANWYAAQQDSHFDFSIQWERDLPFVPWLVPAYLSIFALFALPLFAGPVERMHAVAWRMALAIVIGGVAFVLVPGELAFQRPATAPGFQAVFDVIHALDRPHNLLPSLHVALSATVVWAVMKGAGPGSRLLLGGWLALICVAVVLVHQHHVADVAGGLVLAALCTRLVREGSSG